MNTAYKVFVILFLFFQTLMIAGVAPKNIRYNYSTEVLMQVIFSISKINNLYNFFSDPANTGGYNYTTNNIYMFKQESAGLRKFSVSIDESIQHIVLPLNASRINNIQSLSTADTLFYNAVVRSEALFFFNKYETYPLIYFEVLNHHCSAKVIGNRFVRVEKVDTIYSNYFTLN